MIKEHKNRLTAIRSNRAISEQMQTAVHGIQDNNYDRTRYQTLNSCSLSIQNFEKLSAKLSETKSITTKADIKEKQ